MKEDINYMKLFAFHEEVIEEASAVLTSISNVKVLCKGVYDESGSTLKNLKLS